MTNQEINRAVAEKIMDISLKPERNRAIVAVAWKWIHVTGHVFILGPATDRDRHKISCPPGDTLPSPYEDARWNDRYMLYAGNKIIEAGDQQFIDAVDAYEEQPRDYANDPAAVFGPGGVVEKMEALGHEWAVYSDGDERAAYFFIPHDDDDKDAMKHLRFDPSITRAVCLAALAAVGGLGGGCAVQVHR